MQLKRFWDLETLGIGEAEPDVYDKFLEGVSFKACRYEVELPWKEIHPDLPENYQLCQRRLWNLVKRLQQEPSVLKEYDGIIKEQLNKGIIEVVTDNDSSKLAKVHYLPHHPIIRKDKQTTKMRVVYDASARCNGPSLNDCLHASPAFGQNVLDIILRFRLYATALTGDIEKAFLMVSIATKDKQNCNSSGLIILHQVYPR